MSFFEFEQIADMFFPFVFEWIEFKLKFFQLSDLFLRERIFIPTNFGGPLSEAQIHFRDTTEVTVNPFVLSEQHQIPFPAPFIHLDDSSSELKVLLSMMANGLPRVEMTHVYA
jgi:hypothetical protein